MLAIVTKEYSISDCSPLQHIYVYTSFLRIHVFFQLFFSKDVILKHLRFNLIHISNVSCLLLAVCDFLISAGWHLPFVPFSHIVTGDTRTGNNLSVSSTIL